MSTTPLRKAVLDILRTWAEVDQGAHPELYNGNPTIELSMSCDECCDDSLYTLNLGPLADRIIEAIEGGRLPSVTYQKGNVPCLSSN